MVFPVGSNRLGRPSVGKSLADAMRRHASPERIAQMAWELAETAEDERVRLAALIFIAERGYGKVREKLDARSLLAELAAQISAMTPDERVQFIREAAPQISATVPVDERESMLDQTRQQQASLPPESDDA